jgi:mono/diheme cytochrome c family protein
MKQIISGVLVLTFALAACKSKQKTTDTAVKKGPDCASTSYTYTADIKPIMESNCVRCHNTNMKAGYNFGDVESVKKAGSNGYLLGTIKHEAGYMAMPAYAEPLDQATINKIECWINTGMK